MKATRKLIPALALLLISAVLLSTATYAWFTTNSQVTATMSVKVQAPLNLEIASSNSGPWLTTTLALNGAGDPKALIPVSSTDGLSFVKCTKNQGGTASFTEPKDNITIPGTLEFSNVAEGDVYKVQKDLWLRSVGNNATVTMAFTVDNPGDSESPMQASVRIAVFEGSVATGNLKAVLYPSSNTANATPHHDYYIQKGVDKYSCVATTDGIMKESVKVDLTSSTPAHYYFVIWIEGNDANTVHTNWVNSNFDITLTFDAAEPAGT